MARWVVVAVVALVVFALGGLVLPLVLKTRGRADEASSRNNLRQIAQFAANFGEAQSGKAPKSAGGLIPPAALFNPALKVDERLSFYVELLPTFDQKRQHMTPLLAKIDRGRAWDDEKNAAAARTRVGVLLSPGRPANLGPGEPAGTNYVGITGVGPSPQLAGCFQFNAATTTEMITDGLSSTLLIGETANGVGPWLRGGFSTARGFDNGPDAKPLIGDGGQFGGCYANGAYFALADGGVRLFSPRVDPKVMRGLATIAGGEKELLPPDE